MRISDWSSDVCSSDLIFAALQECWRALRIFMARFLSGCVAVPICDSRPPLLWGELIIILRSLQETRIFTMLTTSAFAQTSGAAASGGASFTVQLLPLLLIFVVRSDVRRVGNECVSRCRSRWLTLNK